MEVVADGVTLLLVAVSFAVSATVGLGGSLVLIPTLTVALGAKEAIPLAALLLGANNAVKVVGYRRTIPWRAAVGVVLALSVGAALGARALVAAPEWSVTAAVVASFAATLVSERRGHRRGSTAASPLLAFGAGATSGFSGTSGPLKGVALRALRLDRRHLAGGASIASLAGDLTKAGVFAHAGLLDGASLRWALAAVPLMLAATAGGVRTNRRIGEPAFAVLFWAVMGGYTARLLLP
jgi:uncharacterized protein